ncbi:MAG TPA: tripartite tricarboxylate transporter permease [Thermodesulfobacteriota bacterium]|nr:tripartite tricarboxylate transporter permease [Thermodesulfobacteriota bacterium]
MDIWQGLLQGFAVCFEPSKLLACFFGVLVGTAVGVLPGIGPSGGVALLIPLTFHMDAASAVIMIAGIYYGTQYGGSTTSILVNVPGEAASVITCLDGYQMARQGRAGAALGISAFGSFIAGTIGVVGLMVVAPPLAEFALKFGPPELFALVFLAFTLVAFLSSGSMIKSLMMAVLGLLLSTVGQEAITAIPRFTFGSVNLQAGLDLVPLIMGVFGVSEVLLSLEEIRSGGSTRLQPVPRFWDLFPDRKDWKRSVSPIGRGSLLGFLIGLLPGGTGIIASFASYAIEKRVSKKPKDFGKGAIEGVAGPESANNAAAQGAFIPLLTLGIPGNAVMALTLGALKIHGVIPGPLMIKEHPNVFWGVVASMYLGNFMLLILNLPLIGIWVRLLRISTSILYPMIIFFCIIGAFSVNNSLFDVGTLFVFGLLGYLLRRLHFDLAPLILGFILGPILETSARQALIMSAGQFSIFFSSTITTILFGLVVVVLATAVYSEFKKGRLGRGMETLKQEMEAQEKF